MKKCELCEQTEEMSELFPILDRKRETVAYFCEYHYRLAMGESIGVIDKLKHALRHRGGSMKGEPSEMSFTNKILTVFILLIFIGFSAFSFLRMYIIMPFETSIGLAHACAYSGLMIIVCNGLGWKFYWEEWFKQYNFAKLIFVLSFIGGFFMILIPIGLYWDLLIEWLNKMVFL